MSVLSAATVIQRVDAGEIFVSSTFAVEQLWAGKYNLRLAADGLIIPYGPDRKFKKYWPGGAERVEPGGFELHTGETALISTQELFCVPWDIGGIVGPKFTLARHGLLVLTGSVVDPGFGLVEEDGEWKAQPDERLHFLVANLGRDPYSLVPGEPIAAIQFFNLDESADRPRQRRVESTKGIFEEFYRGNAIESAGLAFITHLQATRAEVTAMREELRGEIADLNARLQAVVGKTESLEKGTFQLVFFGVFLLSVTLFGAFLTMGIGFWHKTTMNWWQTIVTLVVSLAVTLLVWRLVDREARLRSKKNAGVVGG